ncbi:MAG: hypothetical protein ACK5BN_22095, partial [Planctomycetota bacterium]
DREALQRCLAKDPTARVASVRELLAALGGPPAAPRAPQPPPLAPAVRPAAPGGNAAAAAQVWRPRLAAFLRRLEPLHGGLGIVGLMVALALFAALAARCGGGGR